MLKNIDNILSPELLFHLRSMGHGDELVIVDANFPAAATAKRLIRMDGTNSTRILEAILSLMPLDDFVEHAAQVMKVVGSDELAEITNEYKNIITQFSGIQHTNILGIERFKFYEKAKNAYLIVATSEHRLYGNILLTKGIIRP